ncbi:hypothetical protein M9H77_04029 [Catharanthus roseus]|uniref:Uncharacterized protein n=1 Tax=Catharanthus roseus TaxID=4058 RepID=A0ACC0CCZ5_CATRO|nr:hypothetical protein M9H77_04029 [Catharanthus roseus]
MRESCQGLAQGYPYTRQRVAQALISSVSTLSCVCRLCVALFCCCWNLAGSCTCLPCSVFLAVVVFVLYPVSPGWFSGELFVVCLQCWGGGACFYSVVVCWLPASGMGDRNTVVIERYEAGDDGSDTIFVLKTSPSVSRTLANEDTPSSKPEEGKRVVEDKQKRTFASLFHDNRNPAEGITLHKVDFDDFMVEVEEEDVDDVIETWRYAFVGDTSLVDFPRLTTGTMEWKKEKVSYTRALVEIDIAKMLFTEIPIKLPNGSVRSQYVIYENLPKYCSSCCMVGHSLEMCKRKDRKAQGLKGDQQTGQKIVAESEKEERKIDATSLQKQGKEQHSEVGHDAGVSGNLGGDLGDADDPVQRKSPDSEFSVDSGGQADDSGGGNKKHKEEQRKLVGKSQGSAGITAYQQKRERNLEKEYFCVSYVYGLHSIMARRPLWNSLNQFGLFGKQPWLLIGDFNSVLNGDDRQEKLQVSSYEVRDFLDCCIDLGLSDIIYTGAHYTWSNGNAWSKIDRALCNQIWQMEGLYAAAHFLPPENSKLLKRSVRVLNKKNFSHIAARAEKAREELKQQQLLFHDNPWDIQLKESVA